MFPDIIDFDNIIAGKVKFPYQIGNGRSWNTNRANSPIWIFLSVQAGRFYFYVYKLNLNTSVSFFLNVLLCNIV